MSASEDQMRDLRAGFDQAAEGYQGTRPVCPPQLFDDLIRLAGLRAGDRHVEISCGTELTATFVGYLTVAQRI